MTIKDRLFALLQSVMENSNFNKAFFPMIMNMAKSFLSNVNDDDLRDGIEQLRDKMIPWVLNGDQTDENKNLQ